ncbi:MAG: GNAT family N-acetyltransferase [Chloroflexi bacterium]|nr:GNAT family N-acetyltransferase [Chloroflexota bacterium]
MTHFEIRPYHPSDLYSLYRICLLTGDSGEDASAQYRDHELLGHLYAAPYAVLEPDLTFVLTADGTPVGYTLGARDSQTFADRCEREWFPPLRARYPLPAVEDASPDAGRIRQIHRGHYHHSALAEYPAHLHIDILPIGQGGGYGRRLIETLLARLRKIGVPAVHLGVSPTNHRAIGFYEHVGFHRVPVDGVVFGMRFDG